MTDKANHTPLPCPYCGGAAEKYEAGLVRLISFGCADSNDCKVCPGTDGFATEAEALTAWNTRAVNSHHDLIEALRAMIEVAHAYGEYISQVPSAELERHPYLPGLEGQINESRALLTKAEAGQ